MAGDAKIIPFPGPKRSCFLCKHYLGTEPGLCLEFETVIDSEIFAAKDCEEYTEHG